jgi:hypothetical protein
MTMLRFSVALLGGLFTLSLGTAKAQPSYWPFVPAQGKAPALAVPAAPREAEPPAFSWRPLRLSVALESQVQWLLPNTSRALWGQKNIDGGGLSVQYQAMRLGPAQTLGVDLSIVSHKSTHATATGIQQETSASRLALGASLGHALRAWCEPYARVAVGVGSTKFTLENQGAALSDTRRFVDGSLGAGIALRTPSLRLGRTADSFAVAGILRVEGGYLVGNSQSFALKSAPPEGEEALIPRSSIDVGTASHRAPYLRLSFGLGF